MGIFDISPRKALIYNNYLLSFFAVILVGFSTYLCVTFISNADEGESIYLYWLFFILLGFCLLVDCFIGVRAAKNINLDLLIAHFWISVILFTPVLMFAVCIYNFNSLFESWIRHHWSDSSFRLCTLRR